MTAISNSTALLHNFSFFFHVFLVFSFGIVGSRGLDILNTEGTICSSIFNLQWQGGVSPYSVMINFQFDNSATNSTDSIKDFEGINPTSMTVTIPVGCTGFSTTVEGSQGDQAEHTFSIAASGSDACNDDGTNSPLPSSSFSNIKSTTSLVGSSESSPASASSTTAISTPTDIPSNHHKDLIGAIIGGALGSVIFTMACLFVILRWRKRKTSSTNHKRIDPFHAYVHNYVATDSGNDLLKKTTVSVMTPTTQEKSLDDSIDSAGDSDLPTVSDGITPRASHTANADPGRAGSAYYNGARLTNDPHHLRNDLPQLANMASGITVVPVETPASMTLVDAETYQNQNHSQNQTEWEVPPPAYESFRRNESEHQ